ncbi:hypothetical protein GCM10010452_27560 [Crossiella cryophila]
MLFCRFCGFGSRWSSCQGIALAGTVPEVDGGRIAREAHGRARRDRSEFAASTQFLLPRPPDLR